MTSWTRASSVTRLAIVAAVLGVLAPFAGSPYASAHARVDIDRLAGIVQREEDHVTPRELAQWITDRRDGLRVVDVRSDSAFVASHLPTAERVPLDSLAHASFRRNDVIVLYSDGDGHAAQGWVFLRAMGYPHVFVLREGLNGWIDEATNPSRAKEGLPSSVIPMLPKAGPPSAPTESGNAPAKKPKKRSC
jgi:rhodanese-related sulfurtransferase